MENKHSKCFIVRESESLKFTPKVRQNTSGGQAPSRPLAAMRGREEGGVGKGKLKFNTEEQVRSCVPNFSLIGSIQDKIN